MKIKLIAIIASLALASQALALESTTRFKDPNITKPERNVYTFNIDKRKSRKIKRYLAKLKDGYLVKRSTDTVELVEKNGKRYYKLTTENELVNGDKWKMTFMVRRDESITPSSMVSEHYNKDKKLFDKREMDFEVGFKGYPEGTVPMFLGAFFIRGMDFKMNSKKAFDLWIDYGIIFRIWIETKKLETVKVPAGEFKCIQLDVYPDLETLLGKMFAKVIKPFVKPWKMWVLAEEPHFMVKVMGTPGPPGTPMITINLVSRKTL